MRKTEDAITIIALIVTIIVLLILSTITIVTLTGNNGIVTKGIEAKAQTDISDEKERINVSVIGAQAKNKSGEIIKEKLKEELDSNIGEGKYYLTGEGPFKVTYTESQRSYTIDNDGIIDKYYEMNKLEVGDYVNYTYDSAEEYELAYNNEYVTNDTVGVSQTVTHMLMTKTKDSSLIVKKYILGYFHLINIIGLLRVMQIYIVIRMPCLE